MINAFYKTLLHLAEVSSLILMQHSTAFRMRLYFWGFQRKLSAFLLGTPHLCHVFLLIWLPTVQMLCYFLHKYARNILMMLLWEKSHIKDLSSCFQRAIAYLFPSGLFDEQARPMMKVGFLVTFLNNCSMIL